MSYVGSISSGTDALGDSPRYFYAMRKTAGGTLYFDRIDTLVDTDTIQVNAPGDEKNDYTGFQVGEDFFEGKDVYHNTTYPNLNFEQYRWDNKSIYYYINSNGELVARIGQTYSYTQQDNLGSV